MPAEGRTLGRYRVLDELGRGAMGAVYRAVDPLIEREVAIKTLLPNLPEEIVEEVRERFLREARSAGRLNHPNIVTIFDVGEQDGVAYIAMELLEGRSLRDLLREQTRLAYARAAEIAAQIADALDHAQQFKIVHRDIKPANVMVAPSGRCKLTDFGIAYVPTSTMTQTGTALGSPLYMSPEQVIGVPVDGRSDVFSLGAVLYEMLTGRTPFQRDTDTSPLPVMHRISSEPHAPASQLVAGLPAVFDRILARALAKKALERYARASEMATDLRRAAGEPPGAAAPDEKTVKVDVRERLLDEVDAFAKKLDAEQREREHAAKLERRRFAEELKRRNELAEQREREAQAARRAQAAPKPEPARRPSAIEALRRQTEASPREGASLTRAKSVAALDEALRETFRVLAEFAAEVNAHGPRAATPYDLLFVGRVEVSMSDAWVDSRPRSIDGRDCYHYVYLRYRVNPEPPAKVTLLGADIERAEKLFQSLGVQYQLRVEARDDFGQLRRALFTVTGKLPCEVVIEADYGELAATFELTDVRRPGKRKCRIPVAQIKDIGDELARYVVGVDDEFAKHFASPPGR